MSWTGAQGKIRSVITSLIAASLVVVAICIALITYIIISNHGTLNFTFQAPGLPDGERFVSLRALSPTDFSSVKAEATVKATIKDGILNTRFTVPDSLKGQSYIIEACLLAKGGSNAQRCFNPVATEESESKVAAATIGNASPQVLHSCPYYVSKDKTSPFATVFGFNTVELNSRVYCSSAQYDGNDFAATSPVDMIRASTMKGLAAQSDGIMTIENGQMTTTRVSDLLAKLSPAEAATTETSVTQQIYITNQTANSDSQTLSLSRHTLSITGGNSVVFSSADSTHDGILSSSDWNIFAAKENSLTFDSSFVRAGDTISLMSCAANQVLKSDGSAWVCAQDNIGVGSATYTAGTGISIDVNNAISNSGVLSMTTGGALVSSGGQAPAITLATSSDFSQLSNQLALSNTGVGAGTYNNVTVDAKGRVISGSNISYLQAEQDGIVGNEVAGVINNGGLVMTGAGTAVSPYKVGLITTCSDGQLLKYTAAVGWACANDTDTNTDQQTLSWNTSSNILTITGGNTVDLSSLKDNTDAQTLTWNGATRVLSISGGNSITLPADQDTTYASGNGLSLTSGVFAISAPTCTGSTAKLLWSGTAFTCGTDLDTDTNTTYSAGSGLTLNSTTFSLSQNGAINGDVLMWNSATSTWTPTTPASFSDTDAQNLSYNAATGVVTIDRGTGFTLPFSGSTQTNPSLLTAADWTTFNGKENVLTFSDGLTRTGNTVTLMDCAASQILQRNTGDSAWVCANQVADTNTTYTAGTGLSLTGTTFANTGTLSVTASGALASSGGQNPAITLATTSDLEQVASKLGLTNTGVTAGTYNNVTVDAKGRVTSGTNVSYLTSYTETDGIVGNEVAGVVNNGGLVMTGAGTAVSPYKVGLITTCADGQLLKYTAAGGWACANDTDTNTDAQTLSWNGTTNVLSLTNGGSVDLSALKDNTDSQALSIAGNVISLTNGGSVTLPADQNTTYTAGDGLNLTDTVFAINAPACTGSTAKLLWSGTSFTCGTDVDTNTTYSASDGITLNGTTFALAQQGATTGQVLAWNGSAWTPLTPSAFSDTDNQTLSYDSATRELAIAGGNTVTFPLASSTATGMLSATDWSTFNGKENVLTFSDGILRSGDTVTLMDCAANQILQRNGTDTAWLCANQVTDTNTAYTAGTGLALNGTEFSNNGVLGVTASGALASSGGQNPAITLATTSDFTQLANKLALSTTGVTAGTYNGITVDAQGRVTAATTMNYLTNEQDGVIGNEVAGVINGGGLVMTGAGTSADPYKVGMVTTCTSGQLLKWIGGQWACANDTDTNTDAQALTFDSTTGDLSLTNGGTVNLNSLNTDSQTITLAGNTLSLANGGSVDLTKYLDNTDSQTLSIAGNVISLTSGGSITLPADQNTTYTAGNGLSLTGSVFAINAPTCADTDKLQWDGSAFVCATDVDTNTDAQTLTVTGTGASRTLSISGGNTVNIPDTIYTASTGITITAGAIASTLGTSISASEIDNGTITAAQLADSGATAGTYGNSGVNVAQVTVNAQGQVTAVSNRALPTASGTTTGVLSGADWTIFNGKENVLTFSDGLTRTGDTVTLMDCAANQIIQRNTGDTAWVCANQVTDTDTNTTYTAGTGISITGAGNTIANTGLLSASSTGALTTTTTSQNAAITLATTSDLTQLGSQLGLTDSGVTAGTYNNVTVDAKGRVTAATNISYLTSYTETDGVIGNEVAGVVNNGGLVMTGAGTAVDPYKVGLITTCTDGQLLKYTAAGGWACANDTDTNTDAQTLSWNGTTNVLSLANGGSVDLSALKDNTDNQSLSIDGNVISLTNGGSVTLPADQNTTYTAAANGGLALNGTQFGLQSCTTGQVLKASATAGQWGCAADADTTYSAGTGISIAGGVISSTLGTDITSSEIVDGTITAADLAASGATAGTYGDSGVNVAQVTVNAQGQVTAVSNRALPAASSTTTGVLTSTDWTTFNSKENVLTFTGNGLFTRTGNTITGTTCTGTQILKWNGTAFACAADLDTNTTYTGSNGITLTGTNFTLTNDFGASIDSSEITDGTIANADLATNSVASTNIVDGTIASADIASGAITTTKIAACSTNGQILKYYATDPDGAGPLVAGWNCDADSTGSGAVSSVFGRTGAVTAQNGDYTAGQITNTPAGNIAATTVQAALNELDSEKLGVTLSNGQIWVGNGSNVATAVTPNGDVAISNTGVMTIQANSVALGTDTTGNYVAGATAGNGITISGTAGEGWSPTIAINATTCTAGQYTTWNGSSFGCGTPTDTDTTNFNISANGAGSQNVASGNTVNFQNGTGTTATVDASKNVSFNLTNVGTAGTYGSATTVPVITTDAQGRITSVTNTPITFPTEVDGVIGNEVTNATTNGGLVRSGSGTAGSPYTLGLISTCTDQQLLKWTAGTTSWGCAADADTTYSTGTGISIAGGSISSTLGVDISSSEIVDGTVVGADVAADAFDFAQLSDALTLDASTSISLGAHNLTTNLNGTGDYAIQFGGTTVLSVLDTGAVSIGNILSDQTIGIDNGSGVINIATDSDANTTNIGMGTGADTVRIGDGNADVAITDAQWSISAAGAASFSSLSGAGLTDCDQSDQSLKWDATTGQFICGTNRATYHDVLDGNYTNNTTTFTDVDNNTDATDKIGFTAGTNETWVFEASLSLISNTTADSKWQVTAPSGSTCDISVSNVEQAISVSNLACAATSGSIAVADTAANEVRVSGSIKTGATAGPVTVQFGQVAVSGTSTINAGSYITAYRVSGADYAETYFTHDTSLRSGMITMLEGTGSSQVVAASDRYRDRQLGIVSTAPGSVVGAADGKGRPIPLALSGRVPVALSTENGVPRAGDMITVSKTRPGYGMRASSTGYVVGQLMFDATDNGDGTADGFVYVRHGLWQAPIRLDITKLVGVSTESNPGSAQSDWGIEPTEFNGVDQALIDEIMKGFAVQKGQIDALTGRVEALESRPSSSAITLDDLQQLMNSSTSGLRFSSEVVFEDNVTFASNMSGSVTISPQTTSATVLFTRPHPGEPSVTLTPKDFTGTNWRVRDVTAQGFTVELQDPLDEMVRFNWQAIYTNDQ